MHVNLRFDSLEVTAIKREFPALPPAECRVRCRGGRPARHGKVSEELRKRKRPDVTPAQRKAVGERLGRYWKQRRTHRSREDR